MSYITIYLLQVLPEIQQLKTWEKKVDRLIEFMPNEEATKEFALSHKNLKSLCTAMYQRILAIQNYDLTSFKPINSPITLLKASTQSFRTISEDFGLQKVIFLKFKEYHVCV